MQGSGSCSSGSAAISMSDQKPERDDPPAYLVTLFIALDQLKETAPESREKSVAVTDLEKLIAWISFRLLGLD